MRFDMGRTNRNNNVCTPNLLVWLMGRAGKILINFLATLLLLGFLAACGDSDGSLSRSVLDPQELNDFNWNIKVSLVDVAGEARLLFKQTFTMPREKLLLQLPDNFLRKENLYLRIENLKVSPGAILKPYKDSEATRVLEYEAGKTVELSYQFRPDDPISYKGGKESFSAPIIRRTYFEFVGLMALIYPVALVGSPPFPLVLEWDLPAQFQVFNSFGAQENKQTVTTDFDKLRDSFFVAGTNMRKEEILVRNRPVLITFQGEWNLIPDSEFVDVVGRLLSTQRATFNDDNFPYFLINFLSVDENCETTVKFAGTAHPNSFRAFFPNGDGCQFSPEMRHLISHELMHMWIGKKIKVGKKRGHIDGKWFTEGWTDYFGRLLAYRAGVLTEDEYFATLNRQLEKYYISNERLVTLRELVERMYRRGQSNRLLEDLPYQQGEIMALNINKWIKNESNFQKSLDDVVKEMLREAETVGGVKNFTAEEIHNIVSRFAPGAFLQEFSKIKQGLLLRPPQLGDCRTREITNVTKFLKIPAVVPEAIYRYGTTNHTCQRWLE